MILNEIRTIKTHALPPDSGGSASAFARFGYDLESALADIVDNSIDSKARNVEIILHRTSDGVTAVSIADDGRGMTDAALLEAMRFAGPNEHQDTDLGTYGLGLKTASLSQCSSLTVISRKDGKIAACRWTTEGISSDWECEALDPAGAEPVFAAASNSGSAKKSGSVVLWQRLTRLDVDGDPEEFIAENNVTEYSDRHGKKRYRFRRKGYPTHHFVALPGTPEFLAENARCQAAAKMKAGGAGIVPGSFNDLCARYYATPKWLAMLPSSRATYRGIIERFRAVHGDKPVALATVASLDRHLGRMATTPAAANNLRKVLKRLFAYSVKIGMRDNNPAALTDGFKSGAGFHTWTDEEIETFRLKHSYGTKARLAMELLLNTSARKCNVITICRFQLRHGKFHIQHAKGGDATVVRALPETVNAIEAMPATEIDHFLVTAFGRPFTAAGFGNWFRDRCNEAGLPQCSAHGLRKAMSRKLAESGASDAQGRAVTGHKTDRMFRYYAEKANREGLADDAMANLESHILANREKTN